MGLFLFVVKNSLFVLTLMSPPLANRGSAAIGEGIMSRQRSEEGTLARYLNKQYFIIWFLVMFAVANIVGCGDDNSGEIVEPDPIDWASLYDWTDLATWTDPTDWPDDKLRSYAYSRVCAHPEFYAENQSGGFRYYENTISTRTESDKWIELSTDNRDSAYTWSEISAATGAYYRTLESERETEKFFEFRRVYSENTSDIMLSRIHKSSYLDRSMYDRYHPSDILGIYQVEPIVGSEVQELIEYMWKTCRLVDYGCPLTRYFTENDSSFEEEIYFSYTIGGDWGICDTIVLGRSIVRVAKVTGDVTLSVEHLREISGACYE